MSEVRDLIIKEELIGEIKRLAEENQLYAENEARFVKKILALNNKVANLHKVISKLQTKVARQKENITTLLHLYTSGKRSKSHKKLREKYRALKARIAELEAESERFTVHSDIERQDDKWIPVSERLPELDQDVLAIVDDDIVIGSFGQGWDGEISFDRDEVGSTRYVTHWMPLPEPTEVQE